VARLNRPAAGILPLLVDLRYLVNDSRSAPEDRRYGHRPSLIRELRWVSGEFQVVDIGSLNGTYVNREPVDSAVLANGDLLQIGKFRLLFLIGATTRRQ
jgi:FHA domain